jgi:hypothetical protein
VRVGIASPAIGRCRSICDAGYKLLMAIINIVIKKVLRPWSVVRDLKIFMFIYFFFMFLATFREIKTISDIRFAGYTLFKV